MLNKFPFFRQQDVMDCGATCLRMICKYYKRNISIHYIRQLTQTHKHGVNLLGISEAAEKLGFRTQGVRLTLEQLREIDLPCILHWRQNHFVVLYRVKKGNYYIADPAQGLRELTAKEFTDDWYAHKELHSGISLLLAPTPSFYEDDPDENLPVEGLRWTSMLQYFYRYRQLIVQLFFGLLVGTILQLITPFLTQSVVDIGINTEDIHFVYLVLIAQLMLFVGQTGVSFIRSWILLHISVRINIAVLTDMLIKLMKLPLSFFELKTHGDIMQRMADQQRIESFLTGSSLNTLFSFVNLFVFGFVLAYYNGTIFLIFAGATILYTGWILLFLKRRRVLDQKRFGISSDNQTVTVELIQSMQEIKLNNSEKQKRWIWETIQARLFKFKVASLALSQYQQAGAMAINQLKNILITFISAKAVIDGDLTLGGMMAVQYVVGMVNSPIEQLLTFIQQYQDAKISLERINEIFTQEDEEPLDRDWIQEIPKDRSLYLRNITFRYLGAGNEPVLRDINLDIPEGKTTALVGMSGSGKTTILKLIMRFYKAEKGEIFLGSTKLDQVSHRVWRAGCGMVMQDGFIFADTIENNIAVGEEFPDIERVRYAIRMANLEGFIEEQPFGLKTRIGTAGKGISQGQRQRLLIARAVYKDPQFILFDEATNALDARNERVIIDNLKEFFIGRTVVVVAHRLSTVSHADNIVVLDKGAIVEQGTHADLVKQKGEYYRLVKNQLELGN
ncbi:peptidase domain-containing ABC transporter [Olivibacter domesticus]|uniref:Bacteriocin-processing peptidase. Cysteine peptidase. MEROPS family C39 n=1 Tax=Olivibacter domesticus TaxID=407022 RepID=A0A1H7JS88_OLID1|nr:peptidase domain-containing ABC transporter [Olivibacter domesticus]SEK76677.1 bacteriocin-processing peptidase. Cysteine peptidase. MEROPS family C39 [Olivibacter domesticus]